MNPKGYQREVYDILSEKGFGSFENEGISVSNIVFPGSPEDNYQNKISNTGFEKNFKKTTTTGKVKITPKNAEATDMLKISEIGILLKCTLYLNPLQQLTQMDLLKLKV